jgi:hypothetical protein
MKDLGIVWSRNKRLGKGVFKKGEPISYFRGTGGLDPRAPVFIGPAYGSIQVLEGVAMTPVDASASFSGNNITYSFTAPVPPQITIHPTTGIISGTPDLGTEGTYPTRVQAINEFGSARSNNVDIIVVAAVGLLIDEGGNYFVDELGNNLKDTG